MTLIHNLPHPGVSSHGSVGATQMNELPIL
jgi:hypothetical protein